MSQFTTTMNRVCLSKLQKPEMSMRERGVHADVCLPSRCCHVEIKEIKSKTDILWLLSEAHTLALWISDFFRHETVLGSSSAQKVIKIISSITIIKKGI